MSSLADHPLRLLPADAHEPMPWRNGGGRTTQIAMAPPRAADDAFDWRVSVADVTGDGPFSRFPGVMRTLALVQGNGVRLETPGTQGVLLLRQETVTLRGDDPVLCRLVEGAVRIFNVMVRSSTAARVHAVEGRPLDLGPARVRLGYAAHGEVDVVAGGRLSRLHEGDAFVLDDPAQSLALHPRGAASAFVALIGEASA